MSIIDEEFLKYATPRQTEIIHAINSEGSHHAAARKLEVAQSYISRTVKSVKKKAANQGYSPEHDMTRTVPPGFGVKGVSTYYDQDGKTRGQWVKSAKDKTEQTLEALKIIVEEIIEPLDGIYTPQPLPDHTNKDLMCVYPIADAHLGMFSWKEESGANWDSKKCSRVIIDTIGKLAESAPAAETALILNLADFFHTDNQQNRTERSGHVLDVDSRWSKIFKLGFDTYIATIEIALTKHKNVIVKSARGNHDDHTSFALAVGVQAYFRNEPRVTIDLPYSEFSYHHFGQSLIGINHGMVKAARLPQIMAHDKRELWGRTRWHTWYTGHIHHKTVEEFTGCVCESFRSPAAKDKYTHSSGYRAERDLVMIKHHIDRGEIGRNIETIF